MTSWSTSTSAAVRDPSLARISGKLRVVDVPVCSPDGAKRNPGLSNPDLLARSALALLPDPARCVLLLEVAQIRRLLPFLGGHQVTVRAQHVVVVLDADMGIVLRADLLDPIVPPI